MALPTNGRVIIETTAGEIEIELWSKETPKTCRNFLALAMEGYYDGVIFHRIVPGFLVQTGDRTGTGQGGESFFGEPFEDEIHPRLRYAHRGIVGMANNGSKNSNDSQFFITLDRADELHGKNTLFGRCVGDTVYNVMKIGEMEIDGEGRPVYPPKIKSIRIIDNPFDDIVPRITAAERRAQQKAREGAQKEREEMERRKGAKKDKKLLSFGADEDMEEEEVTFKKKPIFRPDLVTTSTKTAAASIPDFVTQPTKPLKAEGSGKAKPKDEDEKRADKKEDDISKIRQKHAEEQAASRNSRMTEIEKMEADIRKLTKRRDGNLSDDEPVTKKPKKSALQEELDKYANARRGAKKGKKKDESATLAALSSFRGMLKSTVVEDSMGDDDGPEKGEGGGGEEEGMEVDRDTGFMGHALHFPKDNTEEVEKAERDYEVIDPRLRSAKAKEEERERRMKQNKGRGGHRGGGGGGYGRHGGGGGRGEGRNEEARGGDRYRR